MILGRATRGVHESIFGPPIYCSSDRREKFEVPSHPICCRSDPIEKLLLLTNVDQKNVGRPYSKDSLVTKLGPIVAVRGAKVVDIAVNTANRKMQLCISAFLH